jgi:hypothetical protein
MPNIWDGCVKIHKACGGVCRWVEAVTRLGAGYHGECLHCGATELYTEEMIPLQDFDERQLLRVAPTDALAGLEWSEYDDWETNQARLRAVVDEVVRKPYYVAGGVQGDV